MCACVSVCVCECVWVCVIECSSSQQMLPLPVLPLGLTYLLPIARLVILGVSFFQASGIQKHCYHFPCLPDTQSNGVTISSSPSSPKALVSPPVPVRHVSVCVLSFFLLIGFSPVIHLKKKKKKTHSPTISKLQEICTLNTSPWLHLCCSRNSSPPGPHEMTYF